jgi:hypothetical protein
MKMQVMAIPLFPRLTKKEINADTKQHHKSDPCGFQPGAECGSGSDSGWIINRQHYTESIENHPEDSRRLLCHIQSVKMGRQRMPRAPPRSKA